MNKVFIDVVSGSAVLRVRRETERNIAFSESVILEASGLLEMTAAMREDVEKMTKAGQVLVVVIAVPVPGEPP
jgi:hypothetical protein